MRNRSCLFDHHQRSHYDTITIGLEGKFNWVRQLMNSQKGKVVRQSRGEFQHETFSQLSQPIPKPIFDRSGQLEDTQGVFVVEGETSFFPWDPWKKVSTKNFVFKMKQGNLSWRSAWLKLGICLKISVFSKLTMDQGNLMSATAQVHTQWKTTCSWRKSWHCVIQHGQRVQPCNQRGGPRLQHSRTTTFCSETIHMAPFQNLIQKIENHAHRRALQSDLRQHRQFNLFCQESLELFLEVRNVELCELPLLRK